MTSVMGNKNSSLGHVVLKSRKSMRTLNFPFFLRTGTTLAVQSGCCSFRMKPHSMNLWTLILITSIMSGQNRHYYCLTDIVSGLILRNAWPHEGQDQACLYSSKQKNLYIFCMRDIRSFFYVGDKLLLMEISFGCVWSPIPTWITLSSVRGSCYLKCFSHWRSNCWANRSVSNGLISSSCTTWLIAIILAKRFLKTTPTLIS